MLKEVWLSRLCVIQHLSQHGCRKCSYHFLWVAYKLHPAEGRVDLLHAVATLPGPHIYCILQTSREHPVIFTQWFKSRAYAKFFKKGKKHIHSISYLATFVFPYFSSRWQTELWELSPWSSPTPPSTIWVKSSSISDIWQVSTNVINSPEQANQLDTHTDFFVSV